VKYKATASASSAAVPSKRSRAGGTGAAAVREVEIDRLAQAGVIGLG
jgi:hypothetical protein